MNHQKWLDEQDDMITKMEQKQGDTELELLQGSIEKYLSRIENIISRELDMLDKEKMDSEKWHYFKGHIAAFESVIDDLTMFLTDSTVNKK